MLGDAEDQLAAARLDPWIIQSFRQAGDDLGQRLALLEVIAATLQAQVIIDVLAVAKGAGGFGKLDLLVAMDAEVGEDEFGPALAQVAEEHQPQAFAQLDHQHAVDALVGFGMPGLQRPDFVGEALAQAGQQLALVHQVRALQAVAEGRGDLRLAQHGEQLLQAQHGRVVEPAMVEQRFGGLVRTADLGVGQLAGAEQLALAHQHAHQQRARGLRQFGEGFDEVPFGAAEQIGIARADPVQHALEVRQVVERVG